MIFFGVVKKRKVEGRSQEYKDIILFSDSLTAKPSDQGIEADCLPTKNDIAWLPRPDVH